jgi:hypothetical protein
MCQVDPKWLRIDTLSNAVDYLNRATEFIRESEREIYAWKWAVISLHGALYSFAICAIKGTDDTSVTYETKKGERMLIGFNESLRRCKDADYMRHIYNSVPLTLTAEQERSIELLKDEYRGNFEHFKPMGWSIEMHDLPIMAIEVLGVIKYLATDTGYSTVHIQEQQRAEISKSIEVCIQFLKDTELYNE